MKWSFNYIAITNNVEHARVLDACRIQQIMVDCEKLGKHERQKGKNTVINDHEIKDVALLKQASLQAEIVCRINPYHDHIHLEIEEAIAGGVDRIMVPMILDMDQFKEQVHQINGRCKILPLIETPYSIFKLQDIFSIKEIDQIHFGLNDLYLALGMKNLFEVLLSPIFEQIVKYSVKKVQIVGFGGVGNPSVTQKVDPKLILQEHLKLGSQCVILARSFFSELYSKEKILASLNIFEDIIHKGQPSHDNYLIKRQIESM